MNIQQHIDDSPQDVCVNSTCIGCEGKIRDFRECFVFHLTEGQSKQSQGACMRTAISGISSLNLLPCLQL